MTFTPERSRAIRSGLIRTAAARPSSKRRGLIVAGVAVTATAVVAAFVVPVLLPGSGPLPAVPVAPPSSPAPSPEATTAPAPTTAQPSGSPTAAAPQPSVDLASLTVSTAGWKTYSSPEYPFTFQYPPDWELSYARRTPTVAKADQLTSAGIVDGCGVDGCTVYVSPPGQNIEGGNAVVFSRNGFQSASIGGTYSGSWLLATVPDLQVLTSADPRVPPSTAAIVTRSQTGFSLGAPEDFGPPYELMLSTTDLVANLALGKDNPSASHPEAAFSVETNWGPEGDERNIVATIMAGVRANPNFQPTQPARDGSGRPKFWLPSMDAPSLDTDTSAWKSVELPKGNLGLRVPPGWKVDKVKPDTGDRGMGGPGGGSIYFSAPSGYTIATFTITAEPAMQCRGVSEWQPRPVRLASLPGLTPTDADGVARPIDLWWRDATWYPAEVGLGLTGSSSQDQYCTQVDLDLGGDYPISFLSTDNNGNPTPTELAQAVAMLASVHPLT